jgi:hypothetical protein
MGRAALHVIGTSTGTLGSLRGLLNDDGTALALLRALLIYKGPED